MAAWSTGAAGRAAELVALAPDVILAPGSIVAQRATSTASSRARSQPTWDVHPHVPAIGPTQLLQPLRKCSDPGLIVRIVLGYGQENADEPHPHLQQIADEVIE
jgi:hypothetical protein